MINIFQPSLGEEELAAVAEVFKSNWIGRGKKVAEFEEALARQFETSPSQLLTVNSCTAGLFALGKYLQWGLDDEVILPAISFVGAANAIAATDATPVFADVDHRSLNMTLTEFEKRLTPNTRAVILLHYGGIPEYGVEDIISECRTRGITVIEDNACSPFSKTGGSNPQWTGTLGDFGVWSFDAMKILCTGDGGLIHCRHATDASNLRQLLYLGMPQVSGLASQSDNWWEVDVADVTAGRHIMNDIAAAIGLEQLKKMPAYLQCRKEIWELYNRELAKADLTMPFQHDPTATNSYYLYWIQVKNRNELARKLRADWGIYTTFRYWPLNLVRGYRNIPGKRRGLVQTCPNAVYAADRTLCLPLHQGLSNQDVHRVIDAVIAEAVPLSR